MARLLLISLIMLNAHHTCKVQSASVTLCTVCLFVQAKSRVLGQWHGLNGHVWLEQFLLSVVPADIPLFRSAPCTSGSLSYSI